MEINKIIKNVFSEQQISYLNDLIKDNYHKIWLNSDPERGRDDLHIGNTIRDDIAANVLAHFSEEYFLEHISYSEYNNHNINPNLPIHKDPGYSSDSLTFDYHLDSTIDWPLCIEDECYSLINNEAIIFSPIDQLHYRPEIIFKNQDYVRIIFFYLKKKS
jgi:hypothetical protein